MIRAFLDSSALFSGTYSKTGGAFKLLELANKGEIELVVSEDIAEETIHNITLKAPVYVDVLRHLLSEGPLIYVEPEIEEYERALPLTVDKDIPVVAGAIRGRCSYIVSHDRAHLVGNLGIERLTGIKVVTPGDLLAIIRSFQTRADAELTPPHEEHNSEKTQ